MLNNSVVSWDVKQNLSSTTQTASWYGMVSMVVLPKPFSTATQFLERQSIATHKKNSKNIFIYY
jgi:hypothetical protein